MKQSNPNRISVASWRLGLVLVVAVACWQCRAGDDTSKLHSEPAEHLGHQAPSQPAGHTKAPDSLGLAEVTDSPNRLVLSSQKTITVAGIGEATPLNLTGYIAIDPRRSRNVAIRVGGRIEKLYVRYAFQFVRKGEKLLDLYSPELSTYQDEYKYLLGAGADSTLLEISRKKLSLLGLSANQIRHIGEADRPVLTLSVYSPYTGYVIWDDTQKQAGPVMPAAANSQESMSGDMGSVNQNSSTPVYAKPAGRLREGSYVNAGETLFSINDLQTVWGILSPAPKQHQIQVNQPVTLTSELAPDKLIHTQIRYVEPVYQAGQKSVSVRTYLRNADGKLKVNSLLTGQIRSVATGQHWIPVSSVYDLGNRQVVWVVKGKAAGGKKQFEARQVVTGHRSGDQIEVKKGLSAGDEIALDAGYLTDSESLISLPQ
ncbi:hypothetical protein GCM10023189_45490 [Nibrella saemangeumensis]|uniref:Membrane fusion protein, Cu(I)/Ag(I) efflux system n=1 Tax=Nibrella saemangeumensis TaxID=1084526 RepID=A0ABP8NCU9_9BACT